MLSYYKTSFLRLQYISPLLEYTGLTKEQPTTIMKRILCQLLMLPWYLLIERINDQHESMVK